MSMKSSAFAVRQDLEKVRHYYSAQRSVDDRSMSIYQIWEEGGAFNDSITPSGYSPEYRSHVALKMLSLTPEDGTIFSLGCGNAFVEHEVARCARRVRAIDCNAEAVLIAAGKGLDAFEADFFALDRAELLDADLVYADGLLGHLFDPESRLDEFIDKLRDFRLRPGTWLVISNDAPKDPEADFLRHDHLDNFWYLSKDYLSMQLARAGFERVESYHFPYLRPISGLRNRSICVSRLS